MTSLAIPPVEALAIRKAYKRERVVATSLALMSAALVWLAPGSTGTDGVLAVMVAGGFIVVHEQLAEVRLRLRLRERAEGIPYLLPPHVARAAGAPSSTASDHLPPQRREASRPTRPARARCA